MSSISSLDEITLHVGEILNVSMDFDSAIEEGVTITDEDVDCSSSNITISNISSSGSEVLFTITSETVGNYEIVATIELSNNEIIKGCGRLKVRNC
jgi:hypothetical protein